MRKRAINTFVTTSLAACVIGLLALSSQRSHYTHPQHLNHTRLGKEEENIKKTNLYLAIKLTLQKDLKG